MHVDVDGQTHVAVILLDDPAADLHDWYGRYLYFAPDELEPLAGVEDVDQREETHREALGVVTTAVLSLALAGAVVVGVRSIPDVKRYLEMRRM